MINNKIYINILKEEIEERGKVQLVVHGNSMKPFLHDGELIQIEKRSLYNIGDIVAYFWVVNDRLKIIIHRIVFKRHDYLLTKGDNDNFIDKVKVQINQVLGVVLLLI